MVVNASIVALIEVGLWQDIILAEIAPWLDGEHLGLKNHILLAGTILATALMSTVLFLVQRRKSIQQDQASLIRNHQKDAHQSFKLGCFEIEISGTSLLDQVLDNCKQRRKDFRIRRLLIYIWNFALSMLDYFLTLNSGLAYISSGNIIWGLVTWVIPFIPGIEWHSQRGLKGSHRLTWFLSSIFFPLTVMGSRVRIIFSCACSSTLHLRQSLGGSVVVLN